MPPANGPRLPDPLVGMNEYRSRDHRSGLSLDEFVYGQGNPPPQVVKMDMEAVSAGTSRMRASWPRRAR